MLIYTFSDGESIYDRVNMLFVKSNLGINGYWHFICPFANKPCRKLYLHDRHFKSRAALPADVRYKSQTITPSGRVMAQYFTAIDKVEEMKAVFDKPYAKRRYRGKMTRKAVQKERWNERQLLNAFRFLKKL